MNGASDTGPHNTLFADAEERTDEPAPGRHRALDPAGREPARHLHRHGADGGERGRVREGQPGKRWTSSPSCPRPGPSASQENGFFEREIIPVTLADGTVISKDDCPRPSTTLEGLSNLKPVFREGGTVTAGNACPLNDGAAAVIVMSDTKAKAAGDHPAGPDRGQRRHRTEPRDHGTGPGGGLPSGR